jgi:taurine dioxygenase
MRKLEIHPLGDEYPFGAVVRGLDEAMLADADIRAQLLQSFEDRGLILFRGVEGHPMHMAISTVFGPLKDHPISSVKRVPGQPLIVDMPHDPETDSLFEFEGKRVAHWLPWHFDHCYNDTLNRAGVLRPVELARGGGQTGFLDGIEAYDRLPPALQDKAAELSILYRLELKYDLRFGRPDAMKVLRLPSESYAMEKKQAHMPRAIHPAVFERADGRKVVHISPWMALGVDGREDPQGEALLEEIVAAMLANATPYFHDWRLDDMIAWDNWRMLHAVRGHEPGSPRRMQRTTILGDYGLGSFENGAQGRPELEVTV